MSSDGFRPPRGPDPNPGQNGASSYGPHHPYGPSVPLQGPELPPAGQRATGGSAVPRWLGRLPYAFVLCGVGLGLATVAMDHVRLGSMIIGAAVFVGALARLFLPTSQVGMLAVRQTWVDVLLMSSAAFAIMIIAYLAGGSPG
jgi:Protein of unknown function (DUF3017)